MFKAALGRLFLITFGESVHLSKNALYDIRPTLLNMSEVRQQSLTLMLSGVIALSYFFTGHDEQRILQIIFLLFFAGIVLTRSSQKNSQIFGNKTGPQWCLIIFFLLGTVSSISAFSPRHAFYEVSSLLLLLLLSAFVATEVSRNSARYLLIILKISGIGCMLYAFKIFVIYIAALNLGFQPDVAAFTPGFSNYRFFNHAQTIALPLLVLLFLLDKRGDKRRLMWFLLAAFWWALLFVTAGRGTFAGLMAGCAAACLLPRARMRPFCSAMLLTGLLGLAIYAVFFALIPVACGFEPFGEFFHLAQRTAANPTSSRLELWRRAIELIIAHPWLGVGPLHYAHDAIDVQAGAHPHNWVLQIGAEWGLPALLTLCLGIGFAMLRLVQTAKFIAVGDAINNDIYIAFIVIGVAVLVDGLFSGLIVMPVSQLLIALYVGCAAGWSLSLRSASLVRLEATSKMNRIVFSVLLSASMLALINGVWPEIKGSLMGSQVVSEIDAAPYNGTFRPRLWSAGYF